MHKIEPINERCNMSSFIENHKTRYGFLLVGISLLVWLTPSYAMSETRYLEFYGTLVPTEQQHGPRVYTLQYSDQKRYFGISEMRGFSISSAMTHYNEWSLLRRNAIKRFHLIGNKQNYDLIHRNVTCEALKIGGFVNFATGSLRVKKVELVEIDVGVQKWCKL